MTPSNKLKAEMMIQIAAGLLATGCYTDTNEYGIPYVSWDGKQGRPHVVNDAEEIVEEILKALE